MVISDTEKKKLSRVKRIQRVRKVFYTEQSGMTQDKVIFEQKSKRNN